ncbi:Hsp20/alpha crystallin family protein [Kineococcus sp. GCM10028916]|uniref:Hsp20/alpha crystallin family protein n=1 Tax=Kineococcus sp. GCM10028916 TaxID=3273394 RepID=UPI0036262129
MNTLSVWRRSPFETQAQFDALVRSSFGTSTGFVPAVEVGRDGDDAVVKLELPGIAEENLLEDVTVEVEKGELVVRGERKDPREESARRRTEIRYGTFRRSFTLPTSVTAESISASYDAGVLTVRVAGAHTTAQPTRIEITTV